PSVGRDARFPHTYTSNRQLSMASQPHRSSNASKDSPSGKARQETVWDISALTTWLVWRRLCGSCWHYRMVHLAFTKNGSLLFGTVAWLPPEDADATMPLSLLCV